MINIQGERVTLRAVEPKDIDVMYSAENDLRNWSISGTTTPFSKYILEQFIDTQRGDIFTSRQLRLMVENFNGNVVGMVDLFDFDPYNHRIGVGILIFEPHQGKGYGADSLSVIEIYCRDVLQIHQIWCDVGCDNIASLRLFTKLGYTEVGRKLDWQFRDGEYHDEILMQRILG